MDVLSFSSEKEVTVDHPMNADTIVSAQSITPARIGIGRTGTRMKTKNYLEFRIDHAAAQDAVFKDVSNQFLKEHNLPVLYTEANSINEYLMNLQSGRTLKQESKEWVLKNISKNKHVQIIVSDGLSSTGIEANIGDLLPALLQGLKVKGITCGEPIFIKRSRVWIQDEVASLVNCDVVISLIGERPGLATARSVSAYFIYRPNEHSVEADRTVISNIHDAGIPPVEAGAYLADLLEDVLKWKVSGVKYMNLKH
ncbi:ethanolamine ammonia-lyase subunit EutC [Bacillus massilioanorexius]|uniref:ethanolamine ammonia-lyase subunit EutC n=1 Tax=Bacillus TaxID=1386 RepID=UPI0002E285AD